MVLGFIGLCGLGFRVYGFMWFRVLGFMGLCGLGFRAYVV